MVEVIEALDDAIATLEDAQEDADTGTGLLLDARIRRLKDCRDTVASVNNGDE